MEKYSAYRDPGTGIQPFLTPVPPQDSATLLVVAKPLLYLLGLVRTVIIISLSLLYVAIVQGFCVLLFPVPPLRHALSRMFTSITCRLALLIAGVYWIPIEVVRRKRARLARNDSWSPRAGDIIVSNWVSWLEIAWLAFRFNPIFVLPITESFEKMPQPTTSPVRATPGRRTGTGSAAVSLPSQNRRPQAKRAEVRGFVEMSLLRIIFACGDVPPYGLHESSTLLSLDDVRQRAKASGRPMVLFPECTTSNGRGLLRFANVFKGISTPVKDFKVFVMCVRIDPPTTLSPTLSLSIPPSIPFINPIPHIFSMSSSILPHTISIRLLAPSDSPSSATFVAGEILSGSIKEDDVLSEACAVLMSDIGRVKRTGMGWEDKSVFFDFYRGKSGR